jgi:hypothetical protein
MHRKELDNLREKPNVYFQMGFVFIEDVVVLLLLKRDIVNCAFSLGRGLLFIKSYGGQLLLLDLEKL